MGTYHELLARLMSFDPPVHIFGGFAEDALLFGRTERPHADVDVLVGRPVLERQLDNARRIRFPTFTDRFVPESGRPLVLGAIEEGLDLEISVHDLTQEGTLFFTIPDDEGRLRQVHLSPGVLDHPPVSFDGMLLRTVSPLALYQIRAGITMTGAFGPPRPKDLAAQDALRRHFFASEDPAALLPLVR